MTSFSSSEQLAALLKAAADPLRLGVLQLLRRDAFGVLELSSLFGIRQSAMSHHLKVMLQAGLVETQREGNSIFYRRPSGPAAAAQGHIARDNLYLMVDQGVMDADLVAALTRLRQKRAEQSRAFFQRHGHDLQQQQERVASFSIYGAEVDRMIETLKLPAWHHAVEVGPGDGTFLPSLAGRFAHVTGLDHCATMLATAQRTVAAANLHNVDLVQADTASTPTRSFGADLVVLNMVLHHVCDPAAVLRDCHAMLQPGGALVICDLLRHDQPWTREACGDVWPGFDSDEITAWGVATGLCPGRSLYLGVRNGFRVQIRHFTRVGGTGQPPRQATGIAADLLRAPAILGREAEAGYPAAIHTL